MRMSMRMSIRHRVTRQPQYGGMRCGTTVMKAVCNNNPCPVNCKHSKWSAWGKCSRKCGGGTKSKTRKITQQVYCDRHVADSCRKMDTGLNTCLNTCQYAGKERREEV